MRPTSTAVPARGEPAETCAACHQRYVYELRIVCVHCSEPVCPLCVATIEAREAPYVCPDCREEP